MTLIRAPFSSFKRLISSFNVFIVWKVRDDINIIFDNQSIIRWVDRNDRGYIQLLGKIELWRQLGWSDVIDMKTFRVKQLN